MKSTIATSKRQFARSLEKWVSCIYSASTAKAIYEYCKTLPKEYKKAKFPLYRGLGLTEEQLQQFGKTKRLKLRARLISSWTESFEVATVFAGGEITIPELGYMDMDMPDQGVVIKLDAAVPQAVVCNINSLSDLLEEVEEELESLGFAYAEDEVLVDSARAHIDSINTNNLVAVVYNQKVYKGKSIQKFFDSTTFNIPEKKPGALSEQHLKKLLNAIFTKYNITDVHILHYGSIGANFLL